MSQDFTAGAEPEITLTPFKVRVLLVDDQLLVIEAVRRMVADQPDIEFHFVTDPARAEECAVRLQPTVILQDLMMPGWDGFDLIRSYRAQPDLKHVPVIVLSAKEEPASKAHGFAVGANDYLVKVPDRLELLARIRYHSGAYISRLQRDEAFRFLRESQKNLAEANIELHKLAALDSLTGIANRRRFDETLLQEWQRAQRERRPLSLLLCDIDCFKMYNDTFGHLGGDLCLKKTAAVLTACLKRPADLAARYGGEEFAIVLPDTDAPGARIVAEECLRSLMKLKMDNPQSVHGIVTLSIGVATLVPAPGTAPSHLVEGADRALYAAKGEGRNRAVSVAQLL
ncbi:two-component system chemotaxis family response regulator WspR [Pseudoduganella lurida]|uniref:diguanylate cyclase n=1 Tax=Pseudoduganella lurida TaxID=1036180 RepID=A0A562RN23_9BURK|nr:diguanylate cyclase [Pseudoduganella lurida]TWI70263.1 two-component system chemotaxis family response regulator WspR [Pseudoduganella lurida]